jgi:hypothetical protein
LLTIPLAPMIIGMTKHFMFHIYLISILRCLYFNFFSASFCIIFLSEAKDFFCYRHAGAKGARRYSSYSFLISALDGGEWSASRTVRALPPGKDPRYPLDRKLGGPQSRSGHRG